jgi:predicted membrane channel-forming protein YqfA (hemolysin III family)
MSFSLLPWQLYVMVVAISGIGVLLYTKKVYKDYPKTFSIGLVFIALGAIIAAIHKLGIGLKALQGESSLGLISGITCVIGCGLSIIGSYNKVKDDPYKRKVKQRLFIMLAITLIIMLILILLL